MNVRDLIQKTTQLNSEGDALSATHFLGLHIGTFLVELRNSKTESEYLGKETDRLEGMNHEANSGVTRIAPLPDIEAPVIMHLVKDKGLRQIMQASIDDQTLTDLFGDTPFGEIDFADTILIASVEKSDSYQKYVSYLTTKA